MNPSCATHGHTLDEYGLCVWESCNAPLITCSAQAAMSRDGVRRVQEFLRSLHSGGTAGDLEGAVELLATELDPYGAAAFSAQQFLRDAAAAFRLLDRYSMKKATAKEHHDVADHALRKAQGLLIKWGETLEIALARRRAAGAE